MPQTELTIVDEDGQPVADVYIGVDEFRPLSFDQNGFPDLNLNMYKDPRQNRTDENGHYRLAASVTSRTLQNAIPIWSVTENGDRVGSISVLPVDLGTPQTITLKPSKLIEASFLMKPDSDQDRYSWSLLDDSGTRLAGVLPGFRPLGNRTLCSLRFRLPAGDYFLERKVVHREVGQGDPGTSRLGFRVEPDQRRVDLGLVEGLSDAIEVDGEWGSVYGRIQVKNATNPDLRPRVLVRAGVQPFIQGNVLSEDLLVDPVSEGLEGAFVYLRNAPATIHPDLAEVPATPLAFGVLRSRFVPHTMIVRTGQRVELLNSDPVAVNIHSLPLKNEPFNIVVAPGTKPGRGVLINNTNGESLPFRLTNDLHPWMQAYWLVVDHPYATITDRHGRFVIENLPPGPHVFNVWHERVGWIERNLEITIKPGEVTAQPTISVDSTAFSVR